MQGCRAKRIPASVIAECFWPEPSNRDRLIANGLSGPNPVLTADMTKGSRAEVQRSPAFVRCPPWDTLHEAMRGQDCCFPRIGKQLTAEG